MTLTLPVLDSTRYVVEHSQHVAINDAAIRQMLMNGDVPVNNDYWYPELHLVDPDWIFVLDALNFCFWADYGQPKWCIEYGGERLSGYWALAGSLKRAVEEGIPLTDAEFLTTISSKTVERIFRGNRMIPLFQRRVDHLREVGKILLEKYEGSFVNLVTKANRSVSALVNEVVMNFPSFNDVSTYQGKKVYFYKRAQLLVADLYGAFEGQGLGEFYDLDQLTVFADYKIPQVLRHHHVLEYDSHLATLVDNCIHLAPGSSEEVEIRAATIQAVERMRRYLAEKNHPIPVFKLDWWLWNLGQDDVVRKIPYHRTLTIFY